MSKRQPTITIDDQIIAHDEILEFVDLNDAGTKSEEKKIVLNAVRLVSGQILPLSPDKIGGVIAFFYRHD